MAFAGRYRETQRGGGFGSGAASTTGPSGNMDALQDLENELTKFRGCIDSIGTQFDDKDNRKEIKRMRTVIKTKVADAQGAVKAAKKSNDPQSKIMADRQAVQLDSCIRTFQNLLDREKKAMGQHPTPTASGSPDASVSRENMISPSQQSQTMSQMQRMVGLEEREEEAEELRQLEADILDLKDIHQDMATMVGEQGEDINTIEKNVATAAIRVEKGTQQTSNALVLKRKNTKLKLVIGGIIAAVVIAVLIVVAILLGVFVPRANSNN